MSENNDRPDLELERLVMGERGQKTETVWQWLVSDDVVRGAVERIKSAQDRARQHGEDLQLAIARQNAALAEAAELRDQVDALTADNQILTDTLGDTPGASPSEICRTRHFQSCHACDRADCCDNRTPSIVALQKERDDLRDQVDALEAQLEEEERMVVRWRERGIMLTHKGCGGEFVMAPVKESCVKPLNMKAMAEGWVLTVHGDGLVNPEAQCGCALGDLMPCDNNTCDCMPARRFFCLKCEAATFQGCLGTPALPPPCFECGGPTVPLPVGAPVPEKFTTDDTSHTETERGQA